jgi:hypothetical protein
VAVQMDERIFRHGVVCSDRLSGLLGR